MWSFKEVFFSHRNCLCYFDYIADILNTCIPTNHCHSSSHANAEKLEILRGCIIRSLLNSFTEMEILIWYQKNIKTKLVYSSHYHSKCLRPSDVVYKIYERYLVNYLCGNYLKTVNHTLLCCKTQNISWT